MTHRIVLEDEPNAPGAGRLLLEGLLYGIAAIQNQRRLEGAIPRMREMCAIVRANWHRDEIDRSLWLVEMQVGHEIDLWPDRAAMTDEDIAERAIIREGLTHRSRQNSLTPATPIYNELRTVDFSEKRLAG